MHLTLPSSFSKIPTYRIHSYQLLSLTVMIVCNELYPLQGHKRAFSEQVINSKIEKKKTADLVGGDQYCQKMKWALPIFFGKSSLTKIHEYFCV